MILILDISNYYLTRHDWQKYDSVPLKYQRHFLQTYISLNKFNQEFVEIIPINESVVVLEILYRKSNLIQYKLHNGINHKSDRKYFYTQSVIPKMLSDP